MNWMELTQVKRTFVTWHRILNSTNQFEKFLINRYIKLFVGLTDYSDNQFPLQHLILNKI